ncbi:MAG: hypothetical protein HC820_06210 [Hydrococcus sp. RM1_1_31]|nr:hypothetical protein [Hydrococcus sp. RM1_1_31]
MTKPKITLIGIQKILFSSQTRTMIKQNCYRIALTVGKAFWTLPFLGAIFFGVGMLGVIWLINPKEFSRLQRI